LFPLLIFFLLVLVREVKVVFFFGLFSVYFVLAGFFIVVAMVRTHS
jgi:hypothetical protein